jgi:Poxvirus A22 protein
MNIISFDIGIKNMAYCHASIINKELVLKNLNKTDLNISKKANSQMIIDTTLEFLENLIHNELQLDPSVPLVILVESQMTSIMKCIQTTIHTFFKCIGKYEGYQINTYSLSPKHKLSFMENYQGDNNYKNNKRNAISFTKELLENKYKNDDFLDIYNSTKKKDDISDAFLMVIYYYEKQL